MRTRMPPTPEVTADPAVLEAAHVASRARTGMNGRMGTGTPAGAFQVVLPVKELDRAKSRLAVPAEHRRDLALAFLADTVDAVLRCGLVGGLVVVTRDREATALVAGRGARACRPPGSGHLNADLAWALGGLTPKGSTAVLMSDLPAATTEEIDHALALAYGRGSACQVQDLHDGGTTMLAVRRGLIRPRLGRGSAARHAAAGVTAIGHELLGLRCDVDDEESLRRAVGLGVGPHTTAAVDRLQAATRPGGDIRERGERVR